VKRLSITVLLCFLVMLGTMSQAFIAPTKATYLSDDGSIQFTYPINWHMIRDNSNGYTIVSNGFILERQALNLETLYNDETQISISLIPTQFAINFGLSGETLTERLQNVSIRLESDLEIGEIEVLENGLVRRSLQQGTDFRGYLVLWEITSDLFGVAMMITAPDNLSSADAILTDIVLSVEFMETIQNMRRIRQRGGSS